MSHIVAEKIAEGKLIGKAYLSSFGIDHVEYRYVKAEFILDGSKINFDKKYLSAFKKADKEITQKLAQMERDMMEAADAANSEEQAGD